MENSKIYITAYDCVSPAGCGVPAQLEALFSERSTLRILDGFPQGKLDPATQEALHALRQDTWLRHQDPLIHLSVLLLRRLTAERSLDADAGSVFGSSRGPTSSLESAWAEFAASGGAKAYASPTSTASALSSAVARELSLSGPSLSISAACATGLQAVIQAAVCIRGGLARTMIAGGAEYANTPFTLAMLKAAKVMLSESEPRPYLCRPADESRQGMVLSEGAAALILESEPTQAPIAEICGWGAASEQAGLTGVSAEGDALSMAVKRALAAARIDAEAIDFIVGHGAGTPKGDAAEMRAYARCFPEIPPIVWHKWCFGHPLGASAAQSLILACEHLRTASLPPHPYFPEGHPGKWSRTLSRQNYALVASMGFGGNACAVIVKNPL